MLKYDVGVEQCTQLLIELHDCQLGAIDIVIGGPFLCAGEMFDSIKSFVKK